MTPGEGEQFCGEVLEPLGTLNPQNAGTVEAPVQDEIMRVRWHDNPGMLLDSTLELLVYEGLEKPR